MPTQNMIDNTIRFEGEVAFMYQDTRGNVTVGVGHLLASSDVAANLPFQDGNGNAATSDAIASDFSAVQSAPGGHVASFYQQYTSLTLAEADIEALLQQDLTRFEGQIRTANHFPDYDSYPAPAQEGLIDMVYNLGIGGVINKFPTFTAAVRSQDWTTAAAQCRRSGVSAARNAFIQQLFQQAAGA